jgi:hypothetical protein
LGKVIQSNRQGRRRSSNSQGKPQQQERYSSLNNNQTLELNKSACSCQFVSRLPVLIKGRRDIGSTAITTETRTKQHINQEYQYGNSRIPRYQHQNHSVSHSQMTNIPTIKRQGPF